MNQTTNKIAIEALIDAAKDALQYHGKHLLTDPPQDAWKHHRVSERLHDALAALAPEVQEAQPDAQALYDAVAKLIKAKGRFHTEQNYAALVKAFDACQPAASPLMQVAPSERPCSLRGTGKCSCPTACQLDMDRWKGLNEYHHQFIVSSAFASDLKDDAIRTAVKLTEAKLKELNPAAPVPQVAPSDAQGVPEDLAQLMKFYAVGSIEALARIQEQHIARLQAKLPTPKQPAVTRVREG